MGLSKNFLAKFYFILYKRLFFDTRKLNLFKILRRVPAPKIGRKTPIKILNKPQNPNKKIPIAHRKSFLPIISKKATLPSNLPHSQKAREHKTKIEYNKKKPVAF